VTESTFATPSAHSSIIICVSIFYLEDLEPVLCYPLLAGLSILVASSRMYFGVHYLQDVIIGLMIGFAFGYGFLTIFNHFQI